MKRLIIILPKIGPSLVTYFSSDTELKKNDTSR